MSSFTVEVTDDASVVLEIVGNSIPDVIVQAMEDAGEVVVDEIAESVRDTFDSKGGLENSFTAEVSRTSRGAEMRVESSKPYAGVQDRGGEGDLPRGDEHHRQAEHEQRQVVRDFDGRRDVSGWDMANIVD